MVIDTNMRKLIPLSVRACGLVLAGSRMVEYNVHPLWVDLDAALVALALACEVDHAGARPEK